MQTLLSEDNKNYRVTVVFMEDTNDELQAEMFNAVANDDRIKLQDVLSRGAKPDEFFDDLTRVSCKNILQIACEKGRLECVRILLDAGAMISVRDDWGQTPIMYSLRPQFYEVAELLLCYDTGIVNVKDRYGKTPLHVAVESDSIESVELLLRHGCNVNAYTSNGTTPLMTLCLESDLENRLVLVRLLLDAGVDIEMKEFHYKRTALQFAAIKKHIDVVELLLTKGADPNTLDGSGRTPLTNVMWENVRIYDSTKGIDPDVMTLLVMFIQTGTDLNFNKVEYCNPLVTSAFLQAEPLTKFFLEYGADPNVTFPSGVTALLVSVIKKDFFTAKLLVQWSGRMDVKGHVLRRREDIHVDSFWLAVDNASWEIVKMFVNAGYNISQHQLIMNKDLNDDSVPKSLRDNPEMFSWLCHRASNPFTLYHLVLLRLWKLLKQDTETKLDKLSIPKRFKDLLIHGDFLV